MELGKYIKSNFSTILLIIFTGIVFFSADARTLLIQGMIRTGLFHASPELKNTDKHETVPSSLRFRSEDGELLDISANKGEIYFINFWATWCPPCREEMPELSELYTEYKNKNVVVLGLAVDELALVKEFSVATPVSYPLFAAENDGMVLGNDLGNDKGVLPYTVIINQQGVVVDTYFGRINKTLLEAAIRPLLAP